MKLKFFKSKNEDLNSDELLAAIPKKPFYRRKWFKRTVVLAVAAAIVAGGWFGYKAMFADKNKAASSEMTTAKVTRGDLVVNISGSGAVKPVSRYDIVPLVKGSILNCPVNEGDVVRAGDLLYVIDSSDIDSNIDKTLNSIKQLDLDEQEIYKKLKDVTVYANASGKLSGFTLNEGDTIQGSGGKIGTITNTNVIVATVPFNSSQIAAIEVGQRATVGVEQYMITLDGTVTDKKNTATTLSEGSLTYDVEITLDNAAAIPVGTKVTATIYTPAGELVSPLPGEIGNPEPRPLYAEVGGKVKEVYVKNEQWVEKGQKILTIDDTEIQNSLRQSQLKRNDLMLTLKNQQEQKKNYNITSPIDGVVITKNYKTGDTINQGSNSVTLMTVADMSKMVFSINIDELDIAKVVIGQPVEVTADALPGENFSGRITKIASEGTSQNGVTTYAVEVTIDEPGNLKPGMNVNANIVVQKKENVLMLPVAAVTKRGNRAFVTLVEDSSGGADNGKRGERGSGQGPVGAQVAPGEQAQNGQAQGGGPSENQRGQWQGAGGQSQQQTASGSGRNARNGNLQNANTRQVEVKIGINNADFIEIVEGLSEGQTVLLPTVRQSSQNTPPMMFMGGGGGGPRPSQGR